jgi:Ca2+-binding EF-hand superfamily protein
MKLQNGFNCFDSDGDEHLNIQELHRFLSSVLSVLFACAKQTASLPPDQSRALISVAAGILVERVMMEFAENEDTVSFEEFGNWYNQEGCEVAPWLELLDLSKWKLKPQPEQSTDQMGWGESAEDDEDSEDDTEDDDEDDTDDDSIDSDDYGYAEAKRAQERRAKEEEGKSKSDDEDNIYDTGDQNARFRFPLMDSTGEKSLMTLRLSETDVATLRNLVNRTGLYSINPEKVCGPLMDAADDGLLRKRDFDAVVRNLIPANSLSKEERSLFSVLLSSIFYNFEATADVTDSVEDDEFVDSANALELAIGLSVLCHGDKSSKLNYAWQVIDLDGDGYLNRAELLFFLRSFLRMLMALSFEAASEGSTVIRRHATEMSSWLSSTVVTRYGDKAGLVSFDDFAQWYQDGFHQVAPWLELLDLSKWVL